MEKLILLVQAGSTWAMVGLIWFVQIVHYPLFSKVSSAEFSLYEQMHQRMTTWVVAPLMFAELGTAIWLCVAGSGVVPAWQSWLGLVLVILIWLSTAFLQVPAHESLSVEFSAEQHAKLVNTNWIRTVAWSLRGVLVLWMLGCLSKNA